MLVIEPRHDRKSSRSWVGLFWAMRGWVALIAAVALLGLTIASAVSYRNAQRLAENGVWATAEVVDRRISHGDESDSYFATLVFTAEAQQVRKECNVGRGFYISHPVGSTAEVKYWRDGPTLFEVREGRTHTTAKLAQVAALAAGTVGLGVLWVFGSRTNRAVLARRRGQRTSATISHFVEHMNSGNPTGRGYMVFNTDDGWRGESLTQDIKKLRQLGKGTQIVVFQRGKDVWWEGDVGPREEMARRLPRVSGSGDD